MPLVTKNIPLTHTTTHQPPLEPRRAESPVANALVAGVATVKVGNAKISRKNRVESADRHACYNHFQLHRVT